MTPSAKQLGIFKELYNDCLKTAIEIRHQLDGIMLNIDKPDPTISIEETYKGSLIPPCFQTLAYTRSDIFANYENIGKYYYLDTLFQLYGALLTIFVPNQHKHWDHAPEHFIYRNEEDYKNLICSFVDNMLLEIKATADKDAHVLAKYVSEQQKIAMCLFIGFLEKHNILVQIGYKKNILEP
jgi:hypothetical protein